MTLWSYGIPSGIGFLLLNLSAHPACHKPCVKCWPDTVCTQLMTTTEAGRSWAAVTAYHRQEGFNS